ncbi:MAG TPA: KinB-signaling pathway activation protein [Bacillus sp. (in: firmicutes)]|uniref:KinB-signaling pathway activation protein n=1 Tax=Bacillus litorisediminis TaxID=2922713 RepID=UPI001FAC7A7C|nr:KinB-signaling pathway activation protein [Bacillus litorisediminis]HWO78652.1 KinB-signaling pathway activation protein [Bacillus sp. (in: firmicutes)]
MTSRNWVRLFLTTLLAGGIAGIVSGFAARWTDFAWMFSPFNFTEILWSSVWLFGIGLIYSVISQMGFFSYLTIHRFGLGIFKSLRLWNTVQIILIAVVIFDLIYFDFWIVAVLLLAYGLLVAFIKAKQTDNDTFISALFFIVAATTIELLAVLRVGDESWIYFMMFSLLVCNTYQLLRLPYYLKRSEEEREARRSRKGTSVTQSVKK